MESAEIGITIPTQDAKRCRHGASSGRTDDPGKQDEDVRPGRARKQIAEARERTHKSQRERIGSMKHAMGLLQRMRRIESLIRNSYIRVRQIESDAASDLANLPGPGHINGHEQA